MADPDRRNVKPFGRVVWDEDLGWWEGKISVPMFRGARLSVEVPSEPPDTRDAPIAADIIAAAEAMLALKPSKLEEITPHAWLNYEEFREAIGEENAVRISNGTNIWKRVKPVSVEITRRDEDNRVYVSFQCECDWEEEHGLQVVLQEGRRWVRVSDFTSHLTEGDARAEPLIDEWMKDPAATLPLRTDAEVYAIKMGTAKRDEW